MLQCRFLKFSPFRLFRVSRSMKCQNMMGRPFVFERPGGLKYFYSELVDSFVENKNSDIKITCSDLHIFCHNVSVQDKGQEQVQQISSRSTECIFAGPRIDLMSTKFLFTHTQKCMDFHEIHPRVAHDLAHVCIS